MSAVLLENILAQPEALREVAGHQLGGGRAELVRCAELLRHSKRILLSGMGASFNACIPLYYSLAQQGALVSLVESSELLYFSPGLVDSDTTVVLVSRSGESVEVTKLLPKLKERRCKVIAVVNVPTSTLAREAAETLFLNSPPDELVAIQTYTGSLAALALLGAEYSQRLHSAAVALDEMIAKLESVLKRGPTEWVFGDFLRGDSSIYLLGRGPSLASVNAGALLLHEVAKFPAIGMSSAQFRHGPVEVVNEDFRAVVFGSYNAPAELDLSLAEDLIRFGGRVRWVGPLIRSTNVPLLWDAMSDVPAEFAQIVEVIPLQLLAFLLAQARGVPVGKFRFAGAVTLSETAFTV